MLLLLCTRKKSTDDSLGFIGMKTRLIPPLPQFLEKENGYETDNDNKCFIGEKRKIKSKEIRMGFRDELRLNSPGFMELQLKQFQKGS